MTGRPQQQAGAGALTADPIIVEVITYGQRTAGLISGSFLELAARCFAGPTHTLPRSLSPLDEPVLHRHDGLCKQFQDILG